jgi:predicted CXXCH cytochrome family protein
VLFAGQAFSDSSNSLANEAASDALQGDRTYVGPETCMVCHSDKYDSWNETLHAVAWNASDHITADSECYTCHVNGTDYSTGKLIGEDLYGFTATNDPQYDGVSCETCHGPYDGGAGPGHMSVTMSAELCGECHSPFHSTHGQKYETWAESAHAHANDTLLETGAEVPSCIHCHSAEGALPWPLDGVNTFAEMENGITCAVCHDPHSDENIYQFREPSVTELCLTCHSHEVPEEPHLLRGADCATCHMYGPEYSDRTATWDHPANHTMGVWEEACGQEGCHANPEAAWAAKDDLVDLFGEKYMEAEEEVDEAREAFALANSTADVNEAKLESASQVLAELEDAWHDAELSDTLAFHSSWHLEDKLDNVSNLANDVKTLSEDAIEGSGTVTQVVTTTVSENSIQILTLLGLGSAILAAIHRRRRI